MQLYWFAVLIVALVAVAAVQSSNRKGSASYQASSRHLGSNQYKQDLMNMLSRNAAQESSEDDDDIEETRALLVQQRDQAAPSGILAGPVHSGTAHGGSPSNDITAIGTKDFFVPKSISMRTANFRGHGPYLSTIQITYKGMSGKVVEAPKRGIIESGTCDSPLDPDERIVKVTGATNGYIVGLQFTTDKGKTTPWCGGDFGVKFSEQHPGYVLSYIAAYSGHVVDSVQFFWVPEAVLNPASIGVLGCESQCDHTRTYGTSSTCGLTCVRDPFDSTGATGTCNSGSTFCPGGTVTVHSNTYASCTFDCDRGFGCDHGCCVRVGNGTQTCGARSYCLSCKMGD